MVKFYYEAMFHVRLFAVKLLLHCCGCYFVLRLRLSKPTLWWWFHNLKIERRTFCRCSSQVERSEFNRRSHGFKLLFPVELFLSVLLFIGLTDVYQWGKSKQGSGVTDTCFQWLGARSPSSHSHSVLTHCRGNMRLRVVVVLLLLPLALLAETFAADGEYNFKSGQQWKRYSEVSEGLSCYSQNW